MKNEYEPSRRPPAPIPHPSSLIPHPSSFRLSLHRLLHHLQQDIRNQFDVSEAVGKDEPQPSVLDFFVVHHRRRDPLGGRSSASAPAGRGDSSSARCRSHERRIDAAELLGQPRRHSPCRWPPPRRAKACRSRPRRLQGVGEGVPVVEHRPLPRLLALVAAEPPRPSVGSSGRSRGRASADRADATRRRGLRDSRTTRRRGSRRT